MASALEKLVQMASATVTQGSADAFVTAQIATGISTGARFGWLIDRIEWSLGTGVVAAPQTSDCDVVMQVGQGSSVAAVYADSSTDLIAQRKLALPGIAAAVNAYLIELNAMWKAPDNYVVVDPTLNVVLDSTNTGVANVANFRLYYYPVQLSELEILRMIALR